MKILKKVIKYQQNKNLKKKDELHELFIKMDNHFYYSLLDWNTF